MHWIKCGSCQLHRYVLQLALVILFNIDLFVAHILSLTFLNRKVKDKICGTNRIMSQHKQLEAQS